MRRKGHFLSAVQDDRMGDIRRGRRHCPKVSKVRDESEAHDQTAYRRMNHGS